MGAYREQLLREAGERSCGYGGQEEEPSGFLTLLKLKFMICLLLFAGFAWMEVTGGSVGELTAEKVAAAVAEEDFPLEFLKFGLYE